MKDINLTHIKKDNPFLSILIPTVPKRKQQLDNLLSHLNRFIDTLDLSIEIIIAEDDFIHPVGFKRNYLRKLSYESGVKYSCFIDDDDLVTEEFFKSFKECYDRDNDVCAVIGTRTINGKSGAKFENSIRHKKYTRIGNAFNMYINHLCPIKNELVYDIEFPDINTAEDTIWSRRLQESNRIKSEYYNRGKVMYLYNFSYEGTLTQKPGQIQIYKENMHKYR